jgi:hypothetical protein
MSQDELINWAAKIIDHLHEKNEKILEEECHEWFKEYWRQKIGSVHR